MSRQQLKRWAAPLWSRLSQAIGEALGAPAVGLSIQAHVPAHRSALPQPGAQA